MSLSGIGAGSIVTGAGRSGAGITVYDPNLSVELEARLEGHVLQKILGPRENDVIFRFPIAARRGFTATPAEAKCPDGTTGNPCVECDLGTTKIRICV